MTCLQTLKARGFRVTHQRKAILEVLHEEYGHLTAEDVIDKVSLRSQGINRSTIYRTLEFLETEGLVVKSVLDGKLVYHHAEEGHHHHLICRNCGSVFECREETLRPLADALRINYSFNPDLHHLLISGVCLRCHK